MILFTSLCLISCGSSTDQSMCECLRAGEELNNFAHNILQKDPTIREVEKMNILKRNKEKHCAAFQNMSGEKMMELKKNCTQLTPE